MSLDVTLEDDYCEHCQRGYEVYSANITHNLGKMAAEAGIYDIVWRPDENNIDTARQLIAPLEKGIQLLKSDPETYKQYDAPNGWGLYENFVPWLERYLDACKSHPNARVSVSR